MTPVTIRQATRQDARALIQLIVALAEYEKLTPPDEAAQQRLIQDGFGERPRFEAWLAYLPGLAAPVGYAFTFETYSSFLAKPSLYLEDVFVLPEHRQRGAGKALLQHCIHLAHQRGCGRLEWICLDWNTSAQCFYDGIGARKMSEWLLYRMDAQQIAAAANKGSHGWRPLR